MATPPTARVRARPRGEVRPRGEEVAVEIRFADLDEALALARQLSRKRGSDCPPRRPRALSSPAPGD